MQCRKKPHLSFLMLNIRPCDLPSLRVNIIMKLQYRVKRLFLILPFKSQSKCSQWLSLHDSLEKIILTLFTMGRKALFRTLVIGVNIKSITLRGEVKLDSKHNKQGVLHLQPKNMLRGGTVGGKITKRRRQGERNVLLTWGSRMLTKGRPGDQLSKAGDFLSQLT